MKRTKNRVLVIPCSGIGKVHGLLSREATYLVTDELASDGTDTLCLALLVKGDAEALEKVRTHDVRHHRRVRQGLCAEERGDGGRSVGEAIQVACGSSRTTAGAQPGTGSVLTTRAGPSPAISLRWSSQDSRACQHWRGGGSMSDFDSTRAVKIGIISCSGEEIPEGTISRLATLRVLRTAAAGATVTLCLPLFLAGDGASATSPRPTRPSPSMGARSSARGGAPRSTEDR